MPGSTTSSAGIVVLQEEGTGSVQAVAAPTRQTERISILDSLRGIAVFGILLMNIAGFGLPFYNDPTVLNETGINVTTFYIMSWFFDGTQRGLFSILFGAGIILFIGNQERKFPGIQPADIFFRRQLWLLVFGLVNIYVFLWNGDILFDYACLGMVMFVFRNWTPKALLRGAAVCMILMVARENYSLYQDKQVIRRGMAVASIDTTTTKLTLLQKEELGAMEGFREGTSLKKKQERAQKAIAKVRDGYGWAYQYRTDRYLGNIINFLYFGLWDVLQFMFLGMAFFKTGLLLGRSSWKTYFWMMLIGLGLGIPLSYLRVEEMLGADFYIFQYTQNALVELYNFDRTLRTIGFLGALLLTYKLGYFKWLFNMFKPVGQMAFTNYLMQSIIGAFLFYGFGFALYGQLQRYELYLVVLGIWVFQMIFSHIWLHYFNFGPFEWLWRSLTYWKAQPMRKT